MWSLQSTKTHHKFYMLSNTSYRVGKDCVVKDRQKINTFIGPINKKKGAEDTSISRNHALFKVKHNMKKLNIPKELPEVTLTDTNSSYGTFMNNSIEEKVSIQKSNPFLVKDGFLIRFGLQWNIWQLQYKPTIVLLASSTEENDKLEVKKNMLKLGGHVIDHWSSDVTHLTMSSLKLTAKVVSALAKGIPIVTPNYWAAMITVIEQEQGTKVSEKLLEMPDVTDFLPQVKEKMLNGHEVSFAVNPARSQLFKNKTFVFVTNKELMKISDAVESAGGKVTLWNTELTLEQMCEDNVIVIQYIQENSPMPEKVNTLKDLLARKNKRFIPVSEISLAILYVSIEKHCNPLFHPVSLIRSKKDTQSQSQPGIVFAADTCDVDVKPVLRGRRAAAKSTGIIPETVETGEENPFAASRRATRSNLASKEIPVTKKVNSLKEPSSSVEDTNKPILSIGDTYKPSPSFGNTDKPSPSIKSTNKANDSILTFQLDDNQYTMPKSLKQRRAEESEDLEPPSKTIRLSTQDDSQDVIVHRSKVGSAKIVYSQPPEEMEDDEEDLFGFQDTDVSSIISKNKVSQNKPASEYTAPSSYKTQSSLPSTIKTSNEDTGSSNKTSYRGNTTTNLSRKRPNMQDTDEETDAFEFKTIKIPKISTLANESDFEFDDNIEIPLPTTTTQVTQANKKTTEINQVKKTVIKPSQVSNTIVKPSQKPTVTYVQPSTAQNEANEDWLAAVPKLENIKLEDEGCVDAVQIYCTTLIKPRPEPQNTNPNMTISKNVKPFRKSWHPQNQQLPNMISRSELKSVECVTGQEQLDPSIDAERQERQRQREIKWDFPERQKPKPSTQRRRF